MPRIGRRKARDSAAIVHKRLSERDWRGTLCGRQTAGKKAVFSTSNPDRVTCEVCQAVMVEEALTETWPLEELVAAPKIGQ